MPKVRVGTRKGARAWQDHFVDIFEGVSGTLEAESEVPSNHSFERVRDRIGLARRRHLRDRTTRKHEQDVRKSRDQNCVEILTHHQRQNLVRACWNFEGHRRRKHVGKRTGQVRIVRAVHDEDERLPSIDGSQARETDWPWRRWSLWSSRPLQVRSVHCSLHDEAQARLAGHSEIDLQKSWRQLVKTVRYIKGTEDLATFMPRSGKADSIEAYLDGDWACDDIDKKSASGMYLVTGGCRLHSYSRTTG